MCTTANGTGQGCDTAFGGCGAAIEQDASSGSTCGKQNIDSMFNVELGLKAGSGQWSVVTDSLVLAAAEDQLTGASTIESGIDGCPCPPVRTCMCT